MVSLAKENMDKPAKNKRLYSYNKKWGAKTWVKPVSGDSTKGFCTLCHWEFSIGYGGENDLTLHASTEMYKNAMLAKGASNIGASFITSTAENDSEAAYMYHTVKHGLSCQAQWCFIP